MTDTLFDHWQQQYAGDFIAGVRLLSQHCPKAVTQKILLKLQSLAATGGEVRDYEMGKLVNALGNCEFDPTPNPSSRELGKGGLPSLRPSIPSIQPRDAQVKMEQAPLPEFSGGGVGGGVETAIPFHKLHSYHHALLVAAKTDEERADQARRIMEEIIPKLDAIYEEQRNPTRDAQVKLDVAPLPEQSGEGMGVGLIRKLQSLRTRVSLLQKKLIPNAPNLERKAQLEKELILKKAEIEQIESQI